MQARRKMGKEREMLFLALFLTVVFEDRAAGSGCCAGSLWQTCVVFSRAGDGEGQRARGRAPRVDEAPGARWVQALFKISTSHLCCRKLFSALETAA